MQKFLFCAMIIMILSTSACTRQGWYEGFQQSQREKCYKLPDQDRENCLKQTDKSYEEYQRERQEILRNQN